MRTLVIGCNHRSAPVELRERIGFDAAAVPRALHELKAAYPACESVLISTCNRMEWYLARPIQ
jgi:glutamyl-tRNA reductase